MLKYSLVQYSIAYYESRRMVLTCFAPPWAAAFMVAAKVVLVPLAVRKLFLHRVV